MALCQAVNWYQTVIDLRRSSKRIVVLADSNLSPSAFGLFDHPYDQSDTNPVEMFFSDTYAKLCKASPDTVFTINDLPVLGSIGRAQLTVLLKLKSGRVDIIPCDGDAQTYISAGC